MQLGGLINNPTLAVNDFLIDSASEARLRPYCFSRASSATSSACLRTPIFSKAYFR